jgi:hypothetical protein
MNRIWGGFIFLRARYDAMNPSEQTSELIRLSVDFTILLFFLAAIYTGFTGNGNIFYFWVPFIALILWVRVGQARKRWGL